MNNKSIDTRVNELINIPKEKYNKIYRNGDKLTKLIINEILRTENMYGGMFASSEELKDNYKNLTKTYESGIISRRKDKAEFLKEKRLEYLDTLRGVHIVPEMFLYIYNFQQIIDNNKLIFIYNINDGKIRFKSLAYLYLNTLEILHSLLPKNLCFDIEFNTDIISDDNILLYNNIFEFYNFIKTFIALLIPKITGSDTINLLNKYNNDETQEIFGEEDLVKLIYTTHIESSKLDKFTKVFKSITKPNYIKYFMPNEKLIYPYTINIIAEPIFSNEKFNYCNITIDNNCSARPAIINTNYFPNVSDIDAFNENLAGQANAYDSVINFINGYDINPRIYEL
jgi:hypothetical protein